MEFMGPPPDTAYGLVTKSSKAGPKVHSFERVPLSRRASVLRNRRSGPAWLWWSLVRGLCIVRDRLLGVQDSYLCWMCDEVARLLPEVVSDGKFDAVLVHIPPLGLGLTVGEVCKVEGIPLIIAIGDPQGARLPDGGFVPASPEKQFALIDQAVGVMSLEATLRFCYLPVKPIDSHKLILSSPCISIMPRQRPAPSTLRNIMHWGQVAPWRPIGALVDAMVSEDPSAGEPLDLLLVGKIVDKSMRQYVRVRMQGRLAESPLLPFEQALALAEGADAFVVVVSPRHLDNLPSRLLDLLQFSRPILLLAPAGSVSARLVEDLGIGPVADPTDPHQIIAALGDLRRRYHEYVAAYTRTDRFRKISCEEVNRVIAEGLRRVLACPPPETERALNGTTDQ